MRRLLPVLAVLAIAAQADARGLLVPKEKSVPPLAMLNHHVNITIDDQVAITKVEQTFRNHTDRMLEATYIFPVPKGASVRKFTMWVNGKEVPGELVEAKKAKQIYTSIVQRTLDPGLLEYMGNDLLKMSVFPVPPRGDQKITLSYTSVATSDNGLVEYVYPLKTNGKAAQTLEKFSIKVDLKSQHSLTNIYSPSHSITMTRPSDRRAVISFEKEAALLDRDFQLYYTAGGKDVGLTALTHRPISGGDGHFMLLISPRAELSKSQQVPRDMVFVLDTSGSMRGKRMTQARNALKYCLNNLGDKDRFALINFATTVNKYTENLLPATMEQREQARKWVDNLEATGGTAIDDALKTALAMRTDDSARTFNIVFFTDGQPTIGETNIEKIQKNVAAKNTASTRIFTFGVGDDLNASFLDALAEQTRALSTYVRESEDIEAKVSSLYGKISNPVLTNLKLVVGDNVKLSEVYPPELPDLFHGTQLVVLGRYTGKGHAAIKLTGSIGKESKEFVYEVNFPEKTNDERVFVEDSWVRRKVGYLLDQIRVNGEKKELVDEVVTLAKRYGITTPYTSYLIVPDAPVPVAGTKVPQPDGKPKVAFNLGVTTSSAAPAPGLQKPGEAKPVTVAEFAKQMQFTAGDVVLNRFNYAQNELNKLGTGYAANGTYLRKLQETRDRWETYNRANASLKGGRKDETQTGKLGVDLSCETVNLRNQCQTTQSAVRRIGTRNCLEVGGVWIDEAYNGKLKTVSIKAMSEAYFRLLERHPSVRQILQLGNHLVWVTPSGTALAIDVSNGAERMSDADLDALFVPAKK